MNILRESFLRDETKRLEDIHVSDIMFPRQAYLKRRYGMRLSDTAMLRYIAGQGHHAFMEKLIGTKEIEVRYEGVVGNIDMSIDKTIHEFKTTRAYAVYTPDTLPESYIDQERYYVAMVHTEDDCAEGIIDVLHLCPKNTGPDGRFTTDPVLRSYRVMYDALGIVRKEIVERRNLLVSVLETGRGFDKLPRCYEYQCRDCEYKVECEEEESK